MNGSEQITIGLNRYQVCSYSGLQKSWNVGLGHAGFLSSRGFGVGGQS